MKHLRVANGPGGPESKRTGSQPRGHPDLRAPKALAMNSREGYPKVELSALEQRVLRERLDSAFSLKKIRVAEAMAEDE